MTISGNTDIKTAVEEIAVTAMKEFCSGMGLMFDIKVKCEEDDLTTETLDVLEDEFDELAAAYAVMAKGSVNGTFYIVFDKGGVFTLPGIIVMHPARRIEENCKKGKLEDIDPILDAIAELGNLLVGAWDKVARDEFHDDTHLLQAGTHGGKLDDVLDDFMDIDDDEEFSYLPFEITVESHAPFKCGVVLPKSLFSAESE